MASRRRKIKPLSGYNGNAPLWRGVDCCSLFLVRGYEMGLSSVDCDEERRIPWIECSGGALRNLRLGHNQSELTEFRKWVNRILKIGKGVVGMTTRQSCTCRQSEKEMRRYWNMNESTDLGGVPVWKTRMLSLNSLLAAALDYGGNLISQSHRLSSWIIDCCTPPLWEFLKRKISRTDDDSSLIMLMMK